MTQELNKTVSVKRLVWLALLPVFWLGMVFAISFIEAPLKFQAPGITIRLGVGIGRLVFGALNIAEGVTLLLLAAFALVPIANRIRGKLSWAFWAIAVVYLTKVLVIRPPLNARTDLVLAGAEPGQSVWHYTYVAADLTLAILLVVFAVFAAKALIARLNSATAP